MRTTPAPENDPTKTTTEPMRSMWALVTPEMAERWLDGNRNNRRLRPAVVDRYAADMAAGRWTPSSDSIAISRDGRLLNGQHRMTALVRANCTVGMWVTTGMPEESFRNMDRGASRTFADYLDGTGEQHSRELTAALSRAVSYQRSRTTGLWALHGERVTDNDRSDYLADHPELRHSIAVCFGRTIKQATNTPSSLLALAHHMIEGAAGREAADLFMHHLTTQDREPADGTIHSALRSLRGMTSAREWDTRRLAVITLAWNHWSAGTELVKIQVSADYRTKPLKIAARVTR